MARILLVEDEEHLALGLRFNLENAGYEVRLARTADQALAALEREPFDLLLLDVMLPGGRDGFSIAQALRRRGAFTPIVMLTARDLVEDRVSGLDAGADDYITKPFELAELLARIRGLLRREAWARRRERQAQAHAPASPPRTLELGRAHIDFDTQQGTDAHGRPIRLTHREAALLRLFVERAGETLSRAEILERVWGEPAALQTRTIDNFVLRLRRMIEPDPARPRHLLSVRAVGYRFVP